MIDSDTIFMKRALDLALRGAGLVSPNPMVGAVIVSDGQVIGEGFHRYDRLRHAESYALEMAGEHARGSTLYCNLEPCCHHGRTPPCTDSLIEAGIVRVVIAVSDPDSRVSGRGIEQLRSAGITVEVGLREKEALRLNEAYLKYVTSGQPFLHAIIQDESSGLDAPLRWKPSGALLLAASEYDAIALGASAEVNQSVIDACLSRERHRKLAVAGISHDLKELSRAYERDRFSLIALSPASNEVRFLNDEGSFDKISSDQPPSNYAAGIASIFYPLVKRLGVRSILALPGFFGMPAASIFNQADKVTFITQKARNDAAGGLKLPGRDFRLDMDDIEARDAGYFDEITGYPDRSAAGEAQKVK
jgi:pyrimidine deaminase RibD-like protein